jgi:CRP/FNR family transcriptional regulator
MDALAALASSPLFAGVSADELAVLEPALRRRTYHKDDFLFREGDEGTHLYVVVAGVVKISRTGRDGSELVMALLGPGDVLGELALFNESDERTADAQAIEATECVTLARRQLLDFLIARPELMLRLIAQLAAHIRSKDETLAEVAFLDITGRVARKLLELAETHGRQVEEGVLIELRLSQRTLAGMVAASRENVNRALSRFAAGGVIRMDSGTITVLRPEALRRRG